MPSQSPIAPLSVWLVFAVLCVAAIGLESSGLDLIVMDALYRAGGDTYGLRDTWWTKNLLHDSAQVIAKAIAVAAALVSLFGNWLPGLRPFRRVACYLFLMIVLSSLIVAIGKSTTNISCPWDLSRYGGERPYVHLFEARPVQLRSVRCFPGGHSSGGFSLLSLIFVASALGWRRPRAYLWLGIGAGTFFAATQWLRGAHFPSHDVWTAALCWALSWLLFRYGFEQRLKVAPAPRTIGVQGLAFDGRAWPSNRK